MGRRGTQGNKGFVDDLQTIIMQMGLIVYLAGLFNDTVFTKGSTAV